MDQKIQQAIKILKEGGIVIFPTDTAFGIGCVINNEKAIERLFKIRKRPENQAVPVLIDTVKMAKNYLLNFPNNVIAKLVKLYWPGALTIVLPCKTEKVPKLVRGGGNTIGVRIPNHPVARSLIKEVGIPILGPSANFHGQKTPYKFEDLNSELIKLVDYVVKGECTICQTSTVIDCSKKTWKILREGAIKISNILPATPSRARLAWRAGKYQISNIKSDTILLINTSSNEIVKVGLRIKDKEYILKQKIGPQRAQIILPMIEKILKSHNLKLKDMDKIKVNQGPGSFTGLRVGIAVANTLSFALKIPVNNKRLGEIVEPIYK